MEDNLKLLIIDDDEVDRQKVQRSLNKAGFTANIYFAEDLHRALALVKEHEFKCIFLDYQLPGGDGLKILDEIKSLGVKTPVIFITSYSDPNIAAKMIRAGAIDFISKDMLNPERIGHSLHTALKVHELEKQKEEMLHSLFEREKRYRELVDNSLALICMHDTKGKIISVNPAVANSLGYPMEYFAGRNLEEFIAPEAKRRFKHYIDSIGLKHTADGLMHVHTKDGEERFWAYKNIFTEEEEGTCIIGYGQDITARIKAEKELVRAKKAAESSAKEKEQFLANMSHEIRTPMNAILGFTEIILKSELNEQQRKFLSLVKISGENLISIINDILDFSQIEAKKMPIAKKEISLNEIIFNSADLFLNKVQEKNLSLIVKLDENIPAAVLGDPVRLNQIFVNLLGNAIKFTETGGIKLNAKILEENESHIMLEFAVMDTGIGIPAEKLEAVFESFTQANEDTNRRYGGTGLGLTIVKKLVSLMDGTIEVASELDKGTSFTIKLAFEKVTVASKEKKLEKPYLDIKQNNKIRILVAEDNTMNQILAEKVLQDFGFVPDIADNGLCAIEKIRSGNYNLVLMDIQMPIMDGLQAAAKIRSELNLSTEALPIIAMTARALHNEKEKCLAAGMNDYISKPFKTDDLLRKINKVLKLGEKEHTSIDTASPKGINGNQFMDLTYMNEVVAGNAEFRESMIGVFIEEAGEMLSEIEMYLSHDNLCDAGKIAHKFRSSLAFVSNNKLISKAEAIEMKAKNASCLGEVKEIFAGFNKDCLALIAQLKKEIAKSVSLPA